MLYMFKLALALVSFYLLGFTGLICAVIALFL